MVGCLWCRQGSFNLNCNTGLVAIDLAGTISTSWNNLIAHIHVMTRPLTILLSETGLRLTLELPFKYPLSCLNMVVGGSHMSMNCNLNDCSTRRKSKRTRKTKAGLPILPEEVIFNILLWLPAKVIYDVMRCVCREWYNIIRDSNFINAHLLQSTSGLLIYNCRFPELAHFVEMKDSDVTVTEERYPLPISVCATCNGLVLYLDDLTMSRLYVANFVTKQQMLLPLVTHTDAIFCSLAYSASTREYKVVHNYTDIKGNFCFEILTVGVDKAWRPVRTEHLCCANLRTICSISVCIGKFMYWAGGSSPCILSLDVETDRLSLLPIPKGCNVRKDLIAMGNFLCMTTVLSELSWDIWLLIDVKTGEWTKLHTIDLEDHRYVCERMLDPDKLPLYPVASLNNGELLIFHGKLPSKTRISLNVKRNSSTSILSSLWCQCLPAPCPQPGLIEVMLVYSSCPFVMCSMLSLRILKK
ncbi:hypothetical protein RJ639_026788 [Escallonia herrerae]|uniref:F-box domain-containing protein n=1 Tax=Escallonia herrerae TaxID=1293975 RepID=A0AA88X5N6_9ASTE|nr:hypothetical protein RJ639_026788 [Escallonia herrerae]